MSVTTYGYANIPIKTKQKTTTLHGFLYCTVESKEIGEEWAVVCWNGDKKPSVILASQLLMKYPQHKHWTNI